VGYLLITDDPACFKASAANTTTTTAATTTTQATSSPLARIPPINPQQQNEPLDTAGTAAAFEALTAVVNECEAAAGKAPKSVDEVAMGFVQVANEAMCRPIRALTQVRDLRSPDQ